jgi:hypothetical protein
MPVNRSSTPIVSYQRSKPAFVRSGLVASSVRAASVRSSIRRTAVVTDAPTEAACAAKACSFWRCTCACQAAALNPASATKTASSSQDIHVLAARVLP